jgi:uncharacterized protein
VRPIFRIFADGADVTANMADRLLSLTVKDEAEDKSDTLEIRLDDRPTGAGAHVNLPAPGTVLRVLVGYAGRSLTELGTFEVDEVRYSAPPATLEVKAKAAKMPSAFRSPETKSYHDKTLGEIVEEVAGRFGFQVRVSNELAQIKVPHVDQTAESPMAFLTRLAREHNALARPVNGLLAVIPRGGGVSASGQPLPVYRLAPGDCEQWHFNHSARIAPGASGGQKEQETGGGVKHVWWDVEAQEMREHLEGEPPYQELKFGAPDEATAKREAANAKGAGDRKEKEFGFARTGDPALMADQKLILSGFRAEIPTEWRVTSVTHQLDNSGYKTTVQAELFAAKGVGGGGKSGSNKAKEPTLIDTIREKVPAELRGAG